MPSGSLRHELLDDGVLVILRHDGATPISMYVSESEAKRFAWALLADLDPEEEPDERVLQKGVFRVDMNDRLAWFGDVPLRLSAHEWRLFTALLRNEGKVCSRQYLLDAIYEIETERDQKILDTYVCKVRVKLRAAGADGYIASRHGHGYALYLDRSVGLIVSQRVGRAINFDVQRRVLERISESPATFHEIMTVDSEWIDGSVRGVLRRLVASGVIENVGGWRAARYQLVAKA